MPIDYPGFAYAAVVAAGGVFGYYRAGNLIKNSSKSKRIDFNL